MEFDDFFPRPREQAASVQQVQRDVLSRGQDAVLVSRCSRELLTPPVLLGHNLIVCVSVVKGLLTEGANLLSASFEVGWRRLEAERG